MHTSFKIVAEQEIQCLCTALFEIVESAITDSEVNKIITRYRQHPKIVLILLQFKNWFESISDLSDAYNLWLKFPCCIKYMSDDQRQQLSIDIIELLSPVSDQTISLEIVNRACEDAVHDFINTRKLVTVEQTMRDIFSMLCDWDMYRGEYQIILEQLLEKCRRVLDDS